MTGLQLFTKWKKFNLSAESKESVNKLKDVLEAAHKDLDYDASSSDSSSYNDRNSLVEIAKDLETDTLSLMGLDPLFQTAILHSFAENVAFRDEAQAWLPHDV